MDRIMAVREQAVHAGFTSTTGARHSEVFAETVRHSGRLDELRLAINMSARSIGFSDWMKTLRKALDLMDGGAESPQETRLRLLLMKHFPRPTTQIPVLDEHGVPFARVDMGWEDLMIAVEYDGKQHQTDRDRYVRDQRRVRRICRRGWLHIKVIAEDRPFEIIERVRAARADIARVGPSQMPPEVSGRDL